MNVYISILFKVGLPSNLHIKILSFMPEVLVHPKKAVVIQGVDEEFDMYELIFVKPEKLGSQTLYLCDCNKMPENCIC